MVAGQDAQSTGVNAQPLAQAELSGKIGDLKWTVGVVLLEPRRAIAVALIRLYNSFNALAESPVFYQRAQLILFEQR